MSAALVLPDSGGLRVLVVGVSTRTMAESALRAGYAVTSLDYFADSDLPAGVQAFALRDFSRRLTLRSLASAAGKLVSQVDAVAFGAGVENEPRLSHLTSGLLRLGNKAESIRRVRNYRQLATALAGTGASLPEMRLPGQALPDPSPVWLVKCLGRSGGLGVAAWDGRTPLRRGQVLQQFTSGDLCSATFLADGRRAVLVGLTRQYAGLAELGAREYWWCGNAAPFLDPALVAVMERVAGALTASFGLVGVNGLDFILGEGGPVILEVNPRWGGSVDLFEPLLGINLFDLHVRACLGALPACLPEPPSGRCRGKGILYARRRVRLPDTAGWTARGFCDVPHAGEWVPAGAPICTALAEDINLESCWRAVLEKAQTLQAEIYRTYLGVEIS